MSDPSLMKMSHAKSDFIQLKYWNSEVLIRLSKGPHTQLLINISSFIANTLHSQIKFLIYRITVPPLIHGEIIKYHNLSEL